MLIWTVDAGCQSLVSSFERANNRLHTYTYGNKAHSKPTIIRKPLKYRIKSLCRPTKPKANWNVTALQQLMPWSTTAHWQQGNTFELKPLLEDLTFWRNCSKVLTRWPYHGWLHATIPFPWWTEPCHSAESIFNSTKCVWELSCARRCHLLPRFFSLTLTQLISSHYTIKYFTSLQYTFDVWPGNKL